MSVFPELRFKPQVLNYQAHKDANCNTYVIGAGYYEVTTVTLARDASRSGRRDPRLHGFAFNFHSAHFSSNVRVAA